MQYIYVPYTEKPKLALSQLLSVRRYRSKTCFVQFPRENESTDYDDNVSVYSIHLEDSYGYLELSYTFLSRMAGAQKRSSNAVLDVI